MSSAFPQASLRPALGHIITATNIRQPEPSGLSLDEIRRIVLDLLG